MIDLYALRRANSAWYAFAHLEHLRFPVHRPRRAAWVAHSRNPGMLFFCPVMIEGRLLADIVAATAAAAGSDLWPCGGHSYHEKGQKLATREESPQK
jgi:hypothetical protein